MGRTAGQPKRGDRREDLRVPPERLRWFCDPAELPFETTERLQPHEGAIGQERGIAALEFGLEMESPGFNLFVAGPSGTGRTTTARTYAERQAAKRPVPDDWVCVYNFERPDHSAELYSLLSSLAVLPLRQGQNERLCPFLDSEEEIL